MGRDRLDCEGSASAVPASIATAKLQMSSATLRIKDFHCRMPMDAREHSQMPLSLIPEEMSE